MTRKPISKDLKAYIRIFRTNSKKSKKAGKIVVILVYHEDCEGCQSQFRYFRDRMNIRFDGNDSRTKRERIIDRIYILDAASKEFENLQARLTYKVEGTPAWIRYDTKKFISYGYQFGKGLKAITRK